MKLPSALLLAVLACTAAVPSSPGRAQERLCGVSPGVQADRRATLTTGGRHLPAAGTLRILLVFASFPDDDTPYAAWPAHQAPLGLHQFLDPDTTTHDTSAFNLTNYFRVMSRGQLHVVGDVLWVESTHAMQDYENGSYGRANTNLLTEQLDGLIDFRAYDHWTNTADFDVQPGPDSLVDMIVMVWRTPYWENAGEASLGHKPTLLLDGVRIGMGFPEDFSAPVGSGVTIKVLPADDPVHIVRTIVHELSHWLLGGAHPYDGSQLPGKHFYWGMMCDPHRLSSCANTYERERLGWITVPVVDSVATVQLRDFVLTGDAVKYHPPQGDPEEWFYFENHQFQSPLDDISLSSGDRGLWVLHQDAPYLERDNLRIVPSDGRWTWNVTGMTHACYDADLPVFRRGDPRANLGASASDQLASPWSLANWLYSMDDAFPGHSCASFFAGESRRCAFSLKGPSAFSPSSNPSSSTWNGSPSGLGVAVVGDSAGMLLLAFGIPTLVPARRYLGVDPEIPDSLRGFRSMAWGAQWTEGQPWEPNVVWSEVQRRVGEDSTWVQVHAGTDVRWTDSAAVLSISGSVPVRYRVRVRNDQGRYSSWSETYGLVVSGPTAVAGVAMVPLAQRCELQQNYPNPFNPVTTLSYVLPSDALVRLTIHDLLGREVAVLVNGVQRAGRHEVQFDGSSCASGVYLGRLIVGGGVHTRAMVLLR